MRAQIKQGSTGEDVVYLQTVLGLDADGEFGPVTDAQVKGFQKTCGMSASGVVGQATWSEVEHLERRLASGILGLTGPEAAAIMSAANASPLMDYNWQDRGQTYPGYLAGMALAYGHALRLNDEPAMVEMSVEANDPDTDALAWFEDEFEALGMRNNVPGIDTLRHLFVLMIGLGPRESSGKYCEGRDMSASNTSADTAEAGLFQTSWNIRSCSSNISPLLTRFWANPNGFLDVFRDGVSPSASNLDVYGEGGGASYQWLSKYCPLFHVYVTALGLRSLRQHWGPVNRREVELKTAADELLLEVESILSTAPPIEPPVPSEIPTVVMALTVPEGVDIALMINGERVFLE
jgi:peptidoglycan hydrolase-like protein with peptidoglycan-binding domain